MHCPKTGDTGPCLDRTTGAPHTRLGVRKMEVAVKVRNGRVIAMDDPHPGGGMMYAHRRRKAIPVGATVTSYGMGIVCEWRNDGGKKVSCLLAPYSELSPPPTRVVGF